MKLTTVLFDLDGTLLPMDNDAFTKGYFKLLAAKMAPYGYEPQQLVDAVWAGTAAMVKNDGTRSNEAAFWDTFDRIYPGKGLADKPIFQSFYEDEFQKARVICGCDPMAAETIRRLKKRGMRVALATNPIFPAVATESRIGWAGLDPKAFELYTNYENTGYCKPNPEYYRDVIRRLGVSAEECLMVGNDVTEDMVARKLGMRVFLLTDWMINRDGEDIDQFPHGGFAQLLVYLDSVV